MEVVPVDWRGVVWAQPFAAKQLMNAVKLIPAAKSFIIAFLNPANKKGPQVNGPETRYLILPCDSLRFGNEMPLRVPEMRVRESLLSPQTQHVVRILS